MLHFKSNVHYKYNEMGSTSVLKRYKRKRWNQKASEYTIMRFTVVIGVFCYHSMNLVSRVLLFIS